MEGSRLRSRSLLLCFSMVKEIEKGIIFNIQKYSVHDGPGIRTVVFFSGCPLRCKWCSNPESQQGRPQLFYNRNKCITLDKCRRCVDVCPQGAIAAGGDRRADIDRDACNGCLLCAEACPAKALEVYGKERTVAQVLERVEQDGVFYSRSGGGLTLSGGEPMQQPAFALALLTEARRRRINTAMETSGYCASKDLLAACGHLDFLLYDIKVMDPQMHRSATGVSNGRILRNLEKVRAARPRLPILVRTPVIPGVNDSAEAIGAILDFIAGFENVHYEMLPYHRMGSPKYACIGRTYPMGDAELDADVMPELEALLENKYRHLRFCGR